MWTKNWRQPWLTVEIGFSCKSLSAIFAKILGRRLPSRLARFNGSLCCNFGSESRWRVGFGWDVNNLDGYSRLGFLGFLCMEEWFGGDGTQDSWTRKWCAWAGEIHWSIRGAGSLRIVIWSEDSCVYHKAHYMANRRWAVWNIAKVERHRNCQWVVGWTQVWRVVKDRRAAL